MIGNLRSIRVQLRDELIFVFGVDVDCPEILEIEWYGIALPYQVNSRLTHDVTNGQFVKHVRIVEREISYDEAASQEVVDDLTRNHPRAHDLIGTAHVPLFALECATYQRLQNHVGMLPLLASVGTDWCNEETSGFPITTRLLCRLRKPQLDLTRNGLGSSAWQHSRPWSFFERLLNRNDALGSGDRSQEAEELEILQKDFDALLPISLGHVRRGEHVA